MRVVRAFLQHTSLIYDMVCVNESFSSQEICGGPNDSHVQGKLWWIQSTCKKKQQLLNTVKAP